MGNTASCDLHSDLPDEIQPYQGHGPEGKRARNRLAERLSAGLVISCLYAPQGCEFKSDRTRVDEHEQDCKFNPNKLELCHYLGYKCDFVSNLACSRSSVDHLIKNHDAILQTGDSISLHFQEVKETVGNCLGKPDDGKFGRWKPVILQKSDACKFLILAKVVFKNNLKMFTLKCVQLNGEVANVKYEVEFFVMSPSAKIRPIKWKEPTQYFVDVKRLQTGNFLDLDDLEELYTDKKGTFIVKIRILRRGMDASFTPTVSTKGENATNEVVLSDLLKMEP